MQILISRSKIFSLRKLAQLEHITKAVLLRAEVGGVSAYLIKPARFVVNLLIGLPLFVISCKGERTCLFSLYHRAANGVITSVCQIYCPKLAADSEKYLVGMKIWNMVLRNLTCPRIHCGLNSDLCIRDTSKRGHFSRS